MPRPGRMLYLVSYDIPDDKRRTRVSKLLEAHGLRVQYSVFECEISPSQYQRLRSQLEYQLDLREDSLRVYRLCGDCAAVVERVGVKAPFEYGENILYML